MADVEPKTPIRRRTQTSSEAPSRKGDRRYVEGARGGPSIRAGGAKHGQRKAVVVVAGEARTSRKERHGSTRALSRCMPRASLRDCPGEDRKA
jgi:hypothetical protein